MSATHEPKMYGLLAEYDNADALIAAIKAAKGGN